MHRLETKCLIASAGMHLFLLFLLLIGSAFFVAKPKANPLDEMSRLKFVPSKLVDGLMNGGGNPKATPSNDRLQGETLTPQKPLPAPQPQPVAKKQKETPKVEKIEPKKPVKTEPLKLELVNKNGQLKTGKEKPDKPPLVLTPTKLTAADRARQKAEAEAKELAALRQSLAKALDKSDKQLRAGFKDGTKLDIREIFGPGGEASASYAAFVRDAFDNEWEVAPDLDSEDSVVLVKVVVARDGRFISKKIVERSSVPSLNRSVQRALDKVLSLPPFPAGATDDQRTFTIEFNLKAKRSLG